LTCDICAAPALAIDGTCPFCRSPLEQSGDGEGLLDYLYAHVPAVRARRNLVGRGPVRRVEVVAGGTVFKGRLRGDHLELAPEAEPSRWAARLVSALAGDAATDHELRGALSRSGWALTRQRS
jgi:hypothetical protein